MQRAAYLSGIAQANRPPRWCAGTRTPAKVFATYNFAETSKPATIGRRNAAVLKKEGVSFWLLGPACTAM